MMTKQNRNNFIKLAKMGYGDDVVYDQAGNKHIVFRLEGFVVYVRGEDVTAYSYTADIRPV